MKEHFGLFDTTDQVVVHNPTTDDFRFMVGGEREYEVKAGQYKLLHGSAARLYVKKMCDSFHISHNRVADLHNATAEAETAKRFVKKVISDDQELNADTLKGIVDAKVEVEDVPEPEPTKVEVQEQNVKAALSNDSAPAKPDVEPEFPDLAKKPIPEPVFMNVKEKPAKK